MDDIQKADEEQIELMKIAIMNISSGMCLYKANALRQIEVAERIKSDVQKKCCILNMEILSSSEYPDEMGKLKNLLKGHEEAQVVFLCNLQLCGKENRWKFLQSFNYMRDQMFAMNKVWVFGITSFMAPLLNRYARDLYSCIMNHFEFYNEDKEYLARFEEVRYPAGNLTEADKKLREYKSEIGYRGLPKADDSQISDAIKLWNRVYRYCESDIKEWVGKLLLQEKMRCQKRAFSFQEYPSCMETARAWMHVGEYSRALETVDFVRKEAENRLVSPGPELVEINSLEGEILLLMHRYEEAEESVQKALSLLLEREKEFGFETIYANDILAKIWAGKKEYGKAVGLYEKTIGNTIECFDENCPFLAGLWNNLGAVYILMKQDQRAAECFANAVNILEEGTEGRIWRAQAMEKLGKLLEEEGEFPMSYECFLQAKEICLDIEIARRDEKHLQSLNERIQAYSSRLKKMQEVKERTWENNY